MPDMRWHVLVVDDDDEIRASLRFALEDAGYVVLEEADGGPALDQLRASGRGLVVLLDLELPHVSGLDVLATVAASPTLVARHAFLLLTAKAETLDAATVRLLEFLGVPVVAKPFDLDRLLARVAQATAIVRDSEHETGDEDSA